MRKLLDMIVLILILNFTIVFADSCQGTDLNNLQKAANDIKINYEVIQTKKNVPMPIEDGSTDNSKMVTITNESLKITIYNITKDIYLIQTDNKSSEKKVINYSDTKNGIYEINTNDLASKTIYTFEIYSNLNSCDTTLITKITYNKPWLNTNSNEQICVENPTVPVCQKYITMDTGVDASNLETYIKRYLANGGRTSIDEKDIEKTKTNFFKDNLTYILIGSGVILVGGAIYIIVSKKRSEL